MILVIGQHPTRENARDGMVQRIAAMDQLLSREDRVYLAPVREPLRETPFRLVEQRPGLRHGRPNLFDRAHWWRVSELAREARVVLVHSVHWAQHVLPLYWFGHVITDMHGVVPEEQVMLGNHDEGRHLERVERVVLSRGLLSITVSDVMAAHFSARVPSVRERVLTIPNTSTVPSLSRFDKRANGTPRLLYAGGLHSWQNVPEMLEAVKRSHSQAQLELLTPDVGGAMALVKELGVGERVSVRSVAPAEMPEAYSRAHFGFVLRDDRIVNRVSCPTKLQEYLAHGVVPIVKSRELGDFAALGYRTVTVEKYVAGELPTGDEWLQMASENFELSKRQFARTETARRDLEARIFGREPPGLLAPDVDDEARLWADLLVRELEPMRRKLSRYPVGLLSRVLRRLP